MFYDQHIIGRFNNGAVNNPPWSIRINVTEPVGPFSDPYRGRDDFNSISLEGVGRRDAPFPYPVSANSYDEQFNTPLTYNYNLTLEREVLPGWMARAAYVGSKITWRPKHHLAEPGDLCAWRNDRHDRCASCPPAVQRPLGVRAAAVVALQLDATDAESPVREWLDDQHQLHAGQCCRQLRRRS